MQTSGLPFSRLGRYELIAPIGEGGMARVYAGRSVDEPARPVALKVIRGEHAHNREFVAMFLDEARIASRLAHPHVVELLEFGHDNARYFLALELVLGQTLVRIADACRERKIALPFEVIAWIGARVADALHHAHELRDESGRPQEVVHRDINPSNILVTYDGQPKIIDFGLARAEDRIGSTRAGIVKGKLAYMAPEQASGSPVDRRVDIFGLGVTLWELSVGRRLFKTDDDIETLQRVLTTNVPDPCTLVAGYPPELARVVLRAAARDPRERYQSAAELARDLDACAVKGGAPIDARAVADLMRALFPDEARAAWERAVAASPNGDRASSLPGDDRMLVWDDDARKMTWMQVEGAAPSDAPPAPAEGARAPKESEWIAARLADRAGNTGDPLDAARARLELAVRDELLGDAGHAAEHADAALALEPQLVAAHATLRRARHARNEPKATLAHLDAELAAAATAAVRADLAAERARVLGAAGEAASAVAAAWDEALAIAPEHPAALKGRERVLRAWARADGAKKESGAAEDARAWAAHLARMADAFARDKELAAWLHVERARALDALGDGEAAAGALAQALALDPGLGPVRDACVRRASAHRDAATLVALLAGEAELEPDAVRAARLELDAACLARHRLEDPERALALLRRAQGRAPTAASVDRRVLDELVRLHEARGELDEARRARRARLEDLDDARSRAFELRAMARLAERSGKLEEALADVEAARAAQPGDATLLETADRLLGADTARREALWVAEAERRTDPASRARAWQEAARLAESAGRRAEAEAHVRAAVAAAPDDADLAERLASFGALAATPEALERVRDRVAVYARAAEHAKDARRRVAYTEKIALLWEEVASDAERAALAYEQVLAIEPTRVGALLGLARTSAKMGDFARRARALLAVAELADDAAAADELRVRAAEALAPIDAERARGLLAEVLGRRAEHDAARALLVRLFEDEGRWGDADAQLAARVEHTRDAKERAALLASRATIQRTRLGKLDDAAASLRAARALDPEHPALADAILECVGARGDARALRSELAALAESAPTDAERARHWTRAGELDEMVLLDDDGAERAYDAACNAAPDDAWTRERLARVRLRKKSAILGDGTSPRELLERAITLVERGELDAARALADDVAVVDADNVAALRVLEEIAAQKGSAPLLANALEQQISAFHGAPAKLAALWTEAALVEWELPESARTDVYARILELRPDDRAALDAALRRALVLHRAGDASSRGALVSAARGLLELASDASSRFALNLVVAMALDPGKNGDPPSARAALACYKDALALVPRSPTAAVGAARLGAALGDADARIASASALADLSASGAERAGFLVQAAGLLLAARDARKRARAADLLERALDASPAHTAALGLFASVLEEDKQRDRLIAVLRGALARASGAGAVVTLGRELARVARTEPADWGLVVDALTRVREAAPQDGAALLGLAEAYTAQRALPEAARALEAVVAGTRDAGARKKAMFQLAGVYEAMGQGAEVERVLRAVRELDPRDARATRALLALLDARGTPEARAEACALLEGLMEAERAEQPRAALAVELARARVAMGDASGAERAFVEALARTPNDEMSAAVAAFAPAPRDRARIFAAASARATENGFPSARLTLDLAALEIDALGQLAEGIAHARIALALEPNLHPARALLARGLAKSGQHADAASTALAMIEPDAAPLLALADPAATLLVLEDSLAATGRGQEALVAREMRAIAGGMDRPAVDRLRARRLPPWYEEGPPALDGATLRDRVFPADARSVLVDVAAAIAGAESRVLGEGDDLGLGARDRAGSGHRLWAPFERARRAMGLTGVELAVCEGLAQPRVLARSAPWVVVSPALASQPEPVQQAALARMLARVALGTTWIDRLSATEVRGLLVAAARLVVPSYADDLADDDRGDAAHAYARPLGRAVSRAQKKALSTLASELESAPGPSLAAIDAFVLGAKRAEARVAFLLTGDALATLDELGVAQRALVSVMANRIAADVLRFALTPNATKLRRDLGALWA